MSTWFGANVLLNCVNSERFCIALCLDFKVLRTDYTWYR